jgi:hypothetical protein
MNPTVRLGPSIFDHAAYIAGKPAVRAHRKEGLPHDWRVMLLAVDGDRLQDVRAPLQRLPHDGSLWWCVLVVMTRWPTSIS